MSLRISVCLATYNGAKTIPRQLTSILEQLGPQDEVIIVDDCSTDDTFTVVRQITSDFQGKVILEQNLTNSGPIHTFERALELAQNELVFLSDQDDFWHADKVATVKQVYRQQHAALIVHDATVVGKDGQVIDSSWNHYNHNKVDQHVIGNLIKNGYTGAMMAISQELLQLALPFPKSVEMHDQWLFLVAKKNHLPLATIHESLMDYVRHGDNFTGMQRRSAGEIIKGRWQMVTNYLTLRRSK